MDPRLQSSSPEAQLAHYAQTAIPTAMLDLGSKHQYVNQVIQYCEQSYMVQNKDEIERQTKNYLTDALEAVVKDIELIAANLTQYVDLQANCVDSLTSQLDMVRTRMELAREHQAYNRLNQMRRERNQAPVTKTISKSPAVHYLQGDELPPQAKKMPAFNRVPLAQRMTNLDNVGVCLSKGEAKSDFSGFQMKSFNSLPASTLAPPTLTHQHSTSSQGSSVGPPPASPGRPMPPVPAPAAAPMPSPSMPAPTPYPAAAAPPVPPPAAAPPVPPPSMPGPPVPPPSMPGPPVPPPSMPAPPPGPAGGMPPPPMPPAAGLPPRPPMPPAPPGPPGMGLPPPPGPPPPRRP